MKVTLIQTALVWHDPIANCEHFDGWLERIDPDTDLVLLPEMFSTGFTMSSSVVAESMDGPTVKWMRERAADVDVVLGGSIVIKDDGRYFNRFVWVRPDGSITTYDKRHRFRMAGEHLYYAAGEDRVIVELAGFKVCLMVCYDLRFPVFFRSRGDYDVIVCVANWPAARQLAWSTLLRARAIENQAYVVGLNRVGTDGSDIVYRGGSGAYDFLGETLAEELDVEAAITVDLDKPELDAYRAAFPAWRDADEFEVQP